MATKTLSAAYLIIGIIYIFFAESTGIIPEFILKILMIPVLIIILALNLKTGESRLHKFIFSGLLFSWAGDILLEIPEDYGDLFIPGLISFLLAHVMYLTVFFSTRGKNYLFRKVYLFLPVIFYGAGLLILIFKDLGGMKLPVTIYAAVILTMLLGAINRFEKVNPTSYRMVLSGAVFFVISDSLIAVNRFTCHLEYERVFIMSTYVTAQLLIVAGYIRQYREKYI